MGTYFYISRQKRLRQLGQSVLWANNGRLESLLQWLLLNADPYQFHLLQQVESLKFDFRLLQICRDGRTRISLRIRIHLLRRILASLICTSNLRALHCQGVPFYTRVFMIYCL